MLLPHLGFLGVIPDGPAAAPFILPYVVAVGVDIVSKLPTYSGKRHRAGAARYGVAHSGRVGSDHRPLNTYTWEVLSILAIIYIGLLPMGLRSYRRYKAADAAAQAANEAEAEAEKP